MMRLLRSHYNTMMMIFTALTAQSIRPREIPYPGEENRREWMEAMICFLPSPFYLHSSATNLNLRPCLPNSLLHSPTHSRPFSARATNDSNVGDEIVDGMDFGELCNEFECISSPSVEATARQLVRDIIQLRQGNRALGTFAISVKYKDPIRSFVGREKYKRPLWATDALRNPFVSVHEMSMLSTSILRIIWTLRGKPKSLVAVLGGDVIIKINSKFTLNQISGQVIEHQEFWDLSSSSPVAQTYFWCSRTLFSTVEGGKDSVDFIKNFITSRLSAQKENLEIFPDPSGDPTKFFQRDESFQRDVYQIGIVLALLYLVVQFLKTTL